MFIRFLMPVCPGAWAVWFMRILGFEVAHMLGFLTREVHAVLFVVPFASSFMVEATVWTTVSTQVVYSITTRTMIPLACVRASCTCYIQAQALWAIETIPLFFMLNSGAASNENRGIKAVGHLFSTGRSNGDSIWAKRCSHGTYVQEAVWPSRIYAAFQSPFKF